MNILFNTKNGSFKNHKASILNYELRIIAKRACLFSKRENNYYFRTQLVSGCDLLFPHSNTTCMRAHTQIKTTMTSDTCWLPIISLLQLCRGCVGEWLLEFELAEPRLY